MNFAKIINYSDLDISRVTTGGKPKDVVASNGSLYGRRIYLQYDHPEHGVIPLLVKTPKQKFLFGLSPYHDGTTGKTTYTALTTFDEGSQKYLTFLQQLDEKIVDFMEKEYSTWFPVKKKAPTPGRESLQLAVSGFIKVGTNKETEEDYEPTVKYTFPVYKDRTTGEDFCATDLFLSKTEKLELDLENPQTTVPSGSHGESVILLTLYAGAGTNKVYSKAEAKMVKVYPRTASTLEYSSVFKDDEQSSFPEDPEAEFSD